MTGVQTCALPICFPVTIDRYPQVLPTRISADGAENPKYALTTQMYQVTKAKIQPNYYAKKAWENGSSIWASISFTRAAPNYTTPLVGTYYSLNTYAGKAYKLPEITATNEESGFVVTGVELKAKGQGVAARVSTAYLTAFVLLVDRITYNVVQELGRGTVSLANYDSLNNAGGDFSINISFDKHFVIELTSARTYDFYIGFSAAGVSANELVLHKYNSTVATLYKSNQTNEDAWRILASEQIIAHKLRIVTATSSEHENTYTKDGYTYSCVSLSQPTPDSGQVNCDLDSLEVVGLIEGFCRYAFSGGTTSGTSSAYTASISPAWTSYISGRTVQITPHVTNAANATLSVNGLGPIAINYNGSAVTAGQMASAVAINLIYDGSVFNIDTDNLRIYDPPTILADIS